MIMMMMIIIVSSTGRRELVPEKSAISRISHLHGNSAKNSREE